MTLSSLHAFRIRSWSVFLLPRRARLAGRWLLILALLLSGIGTPLAPAGAQEPPPPAAGESATPVPSATPTPMSSETATPEPPATAAASASPTPTVTVPATVTPTTTAPAVTETPTVLATPDVTPTPTPSATPSPTAEPGVLGPEGGEVVGLGGRVRVRFPAGALPEAVQVRLGHPEPAARPPVALSGRPFELIAVGRASRQPVQRFGRPIEIELSYDEEALRGDESGLTLFYWEAARQTWRPLPTRVDPQANRLTALTDHLTVFDFDVQHWEAARLPSLKDFQVATFTGAATYAYPLQLPPGPGGLQPQLTLSYNSQTVDSATSRTQAAWVGMGWSLDTGSIERQTKGTNDYTGDDTFTLVLNGTSSLLLPGSDGSYHTSDERFWRIQRTGSEGSDTWTVWDQTGTQYIFEARARYPRWSPGDCGTTGDDGPVTWVAWRWSLSRVRNPVGQQLVYAYTSEYNTVRDYCNNNPQNADVAVYPTTIVYPHSRYVIRFVTESRSDYDPAWLDPHSSVLFQRARLKEVRVEHDADGNGTFEQLIRRYVLTYGTQVFPNVTWPANNNTGRTFSLDQIAEYGLNGAGPLPVTSFTYGDGMHLTRADNGYGGAITFGYAPWYETESPKTATLKVGTWCSESNDAGGWQNGTCAGEGYNFHGEIYNDQVMEVFHPGAVYMLVGSIKRYNWAGTVGTWAQVGLNDGTNSVYGPAYSLPTTDKATTITATLTLPPTASRLRLLAKSDHGRLQQYTIYELPTYYRVVEQQRFDGINAAPQTFTYSYEGAATNDPAHSAAATTANPYVPKYSEFRGHSKVTETGPDGRTTAIWFHQDDGRAGRAYQTQVRNSSNQLLVETRTTHEVNAGVTVSPVPVKEGGSAYTGLAIRWIRLAQEQTLSYEGDTIFAGRQTVYQHSASEQGGTQYGNITLATDSTWTGSSWTATRATRIWYYPNPTAYLVGLPASQNVYACSGSCPTSALTASSLQAQTLYVYDNNGNNTGWNLPPQSLGHLTARRTFLRWNQPSTWSDPRYSDETFTYDAWGNRNGVTRYTGEGTGTTLASGARTTTTGYDTIYRTYRVSETNALNQTVTWGYANNGYALGLPTAETDPNNATTSVTYDAYGRLLTLVRPYDSAASPTLRVEYHPEQVPFWVGLTQKTGTATPSIRRQVYDGLGRQIQVQTAGAVLDSGTQDVVVDRRFDAYGRLIQETVPYSIEPWNRSGSPYRGQQLSQPSTQTGYDALGRPTAVTAPDGTRSEHRYGVVADGNTILAWHDVVDPNRHRMQTRSDALGRQVQVVEISGNCGSWGYTCSGAYTTPWTTGTTTSYTYDVLDRLTTVTRGSLVTTIGYDAAGRKTQLQDPDMGTWTYAYDGAGNLVRQTDAREQRICFYYDALHRLTGKHYRTDDACPTTPSDPQLAIRYSYDAYDGTTQFGRGRRTGMVDRAGATTWTYDQRGRVTKEEKTITGAGTFRTQWGYRADDRAYKMQFPGGPTGNIGEQVNVSYHPQQLVNRVSTTSQVYVASSSYDAVGRLVGRALGNDPGVVQTTVSYYPWTTPNGQGRLQRLTAVKSADATTLQDLRYATTSTGAVGYDAVGNLLRIEDWKAGSPQVHTYTYDERDRLLSASVTGGIGGNYSEVDTYDPVTGTLSSKAGVTYGYRDPAHRHAVTHRGSTLSATYDANGNQTWRSVWGTSASLTYDEENHLTGVSGGATASYVYDGDGRLVKATVGSTTTIYIGNYYEYELGSGTTRKYYYAGGQRVAMRENGTLFWLLSDHLGSTTIAATSAGTLAGERRYQAWGWARYSSGTIPTNFRFTGQRQLVLGLYYYGARWYDTITGRFIQPDTIVPEPGNPLAYDRYAYALNNPLRYTDPTGHDPLDQGWRDEFYRIHGRQPTAEDIAIRLFSLAFPDEWNWATFYDENGNYRAGSIEKVFGEAPDGRSWATIPGALERLSAWYKEGEEEFFTRDIGTLFGGLKNRLEEPNAWEAVSFARNPARAWVYVNAEGIPRHMIGVDRDANIHHWAWALTMGAEYGPGGSIINTVREIRRFDGNWSNSIADVTIGNAGAALGANYRLLGIQPANIWRSWNSYMLSRWWP